MEIRKNAVVWVILVVGFTLSGSLIGQPSFKNMVAVGDSLMAGVQNGSLNVEGQNNSVPAVVARQVGTYMFLPLITKPGIPNELVLVELGFPPVIEVAPGPSGTRVLPTIVPQNVAIPGQTALDALTLKPELPLDTLEDIILGVPSLVIPQLGIPPLAQIEMAFVLQPTFTLFWLGNNDFLGAVLGADSTLITDFAVFSQAYQTALGTVAATGSSIIVGNIPDPTLIPFLIPAEVVAGLAGAPIEIIGPVLGIEAGGFVTGLGLTLVTGILTGEVPGPLPANVVLTPEEVVEIKTAVGVANAFIGQVAQVFGAPVVDLHAAYNEVAANGLLVGDMLLTNQLFGGLMSLDGIHPTNTGYGYAASLFVDKINETYGLSIPPVDLEAIVSQDPLVPANLGAAAVGDSYFLSMNTEYFERVKSMLYH